MRRFAAAVVVGLVLVVVVILWGTDLVFEPRDSACLDERSASVCVIPSPEY
jgi:hypothetical protein